MTKKTLLLTAIMSIISSAFGQLQTTNHNIIGSVKAPSYNTLTRRSGQSPTTCLTDTVSFPRQGSTAFNTVTISNGRSLGQFFSAPQQLTVSGFTFFAFAVTPNPARNVKIKVRCNMYKAGLDSLPTGKPLASDTIELDTVSGNNILLSRIERKARFKSPVTTSDHYIIVIECDSTNLNVGLVTNSYANRDGKGRNLGCGSINNVWYRCLNLNIGGTTFDCHMQLYPYVKYKFGADFIVKNPCHTIGDTVRFENKGLKSVAGSEMYNYYKYANIEYICHLWSYSPFYSQYVVEGKYRYPSASNENVRLISRLYQWSTGQFCQDTQFREVTFKPEVPVLKTSLLACKGDNVQLDVIKNDNFSKTFWYRSLSAKPFDSVYSRTITNVQSNDSFYLGAVNKTCKSPYTFKVLVVNDYPGTVSVVDDSICIGAVANLNASNTPGETWWFENPGDLVPFHVGTNFQTKTLSNDTSYYVQGNNNGCVLSGPKTKVSAFVSNAFAPLPPTHSGDTSVCIPYGFVTFTAAGSHTLRWFDKPTGGSVSATGSSFNANPQQRGNYKYFVENWNGVCGSGRQEINLKVNQAINLPTLSNKTICKGDNVSFTHNTSYGETHWFDNIGQSIPSFIGPTYSQTNMQSNADVYYKHKDEGCEAPILGTSKITVNSAPQPSLAEAPGVCFKGEGLFTVNIGSGKVNWFKELSDTSAFATGNTVKVPQVLGGITYYYQTEQNGCKSIKKGLTLTSKPRPVAGFTYDLFWQNKFRGTPINVVNTSFFWDFGDGNTSTTNIPLHPYAGPGKYTVTQIATNTQNGCTDTVAIEVNISHLSTKVLSRHNLIYPNPVKAGNSVQAKDNKTINYWAIYNMQGQLISESLGAYFTIPQGINGIYVLRFGQNTGQLSQLITIE